MRKLVRELMAYRYLLLMFTLKELKIRYKQTVMGFAWALLMPVLIVTAGILVQKTFSVMSGRGLGFRDVASVSVKAIPWAFFVGSLRFGTMSLASNVNLITKVYFPREVFPLSSVLAHLVDFAIASGVLVVILAVGRIGVSIHLVWMPLLVVTLILFTAAVSMLLACANLFFRDVKYIVEVILMFGIFFTPVFYDARMLGQWAPVVLLNPIGSVLEAINDVVVLHRAPDVAWVGYAVCCSAVGFVVAGRLFDRAEYAFAENV